MPNVVAVVISEVNSDTTTTIPMLPTRQIKKFHLMNMRISQTVDWNSDGLDILWRYQYIVKPPSKEHYGTGKNRTL